MSRQNKQRNKACVKKEASVQRKARRLAEKQK